MMRFQYLPWFQESFSMMMARYDAKTYPQSLLLTGEQDIGKTYFAHDLAKSILCLNRESEKACGECQSCLWIDKNSHPDFLVIRAEDKSNFIRIDQIRHLIHFAQLTSETGKKVIVIENADVMNNNAANALLKTLEEPVPQCYLILVSHYPKKLPVTITSRCQRQLLSVEHPVMIQPWLLAQFPDINREDIEKIQVLTYERPILSYQLLNEDALLIIHALSDLFIKYLSYKSHLAELTAFMVKNWPIASHMMVFWLVSVVQEKNLQSNIVEVLSRYPKVELLTLYEDFIAIIRLESTTVKQEWLLNEWLMKF